ncbi:salicylate hydroxylase [Rhexocercosporidium sp. MPI-PUGE-AT-0058]|nr:salicylate hydroxylase [Rhexocercosporidium sp. MPI-PUGE-AT-0058]
MAMHYQGFNVQVFEKVHKFGRLGDSLGLGENALRLLQRWGLHDRLIEIGNKSEMMQIRWWKDGKILAQQPLMDMAGYIGHRGDYHEEFLKRVRELGIEIRMGSNVVSYDENESCLTLSTGEIHKADIIVAADGIKSTARELVLGFEGKPKSSGHACFRAYFKGTYLKEDPLCREFVEKEYVNIWIGNDVHLVQNTLRDGDKFNWILKHKDTKDIKESYDMDDVRRIVRDCDPGIAAAVKTMKGCLDWNICYRDPIPFCSFGDFCHPHLLTSAQGASQATESAAVLALCLKLAGKENVALATRVYEKLRFARVRGSQRNGEDVRDRWYNALKNLDDYMEINPDDVKIKNRWLYPFDAEADTLQRWAEVAALVTKELEAGEITPLFAGTSV